MPIPLKWNQERVAAAYVKGMIEHLRQATHTSEERSWRVGCCDVWEESRSRALTIYDDQHVTGAALGKSHFGREFRASRVIDRDIRHAIHEASVIPDAHDKKLRRLVRAKMYVVDECVQ